MSWTNELYNVYEKNCGRTDCEPALLPLSHSTANAQIELTVTESGDFVEASRIDKSDAVTIIPVTKDSQAKASGICAHPFADKFKYIAGDYGKYFDGKGADNSKHFAAYIEQLNDWAESEFSHPAVKAVYTYLNKACIMDDLVVCGVLITDEETGLLKKGEKIAGHAQDDCFVRFRVNYDDLLREDRTWKDTSLYDSFISYNSAKEQDVQLCYATGKMLPPTYKHPSKIRNAGDKGKLISANDESGFSYRGRFKNKEEAISVSYDFSQKMHNALKWLIARQGVNIENSLMLIVWESSLRELVDITKPAVNDPDGLDDNENQYADTYPAYKKLLQRTIFGNENRFDNNSKAMIMGIDSATTGRLSIVIYSELMTSDFLQNVISWHESTAWVRFSGKLKKNIINSFALKEIIECAFGTEQGNFIKANDKVITDYMCRLIPCVAEGRKIPGDIVRALVNRASNPLKYSKEYNWRTVLEAACAMIRKQKIDNKEECEMALDENCTHRSYLYGRLLAVADVAEETTYEKDEKRTTNAKRYFEAFSNRPYTTWDIIRNRLEPYLEKRTDEYFIKMIDEITNKFERKDFSDNSKLDPEYLHAYSCQRATLYTSKKNNNDNN